MIVALTLHSTIYYTAVCVVSDDLAEGWPYSLTRKIP
jgi:hypothetical protein